MTPEFGAVPTTTGQMVAGLKRDPHDQNLSMRLFTLDTTLVTILDTFLKSPLCPIFVIPAKPVLDSDRGAGIQAF